MMVDLTWMVDSGGTNSAHLNAPNLSYKQSYLGHLEHRKSEGKWYAKYVDKKADLPEVGFPATKEVLGPFGSYNEAQRALVKRINEG